MPERIDPSAGYVLEGRVVTMGPAGVLEDGAIYIRGDTIEAVAAAGDPPPAGFADAPRVRTGDTIYPGLIELHNHLSYNAMPLWDVPDRYTNHEGWKREEEYRTRVTKPAQVLGRSEGVVEAVVRFVEARALLGGVTASQGITLYKAPGIQSYYRGIVRNVEQPLDDRLPGAGTRIGDPSKGGAEAYLHRLEGESCYLQHLCEGIDDRARTWFYRLQLGDGRWAITDALCGIHSTALEAEDFEIMAAHGGSMVWSPLSNYLLYGETTDVAAAKRAGVLIGLGCDWAPSGTKNLLGELKVAYLASEAHGGVFSPEEIVAMATRNGAQILKWHQALGTIEAGKLADLVAVNGHGDDDYLHLIQARETSVTLVVIGGVPRVGQRWLMDRFGGGTEEIEVGDSTRVLDLAQAESHPLVGELTLTEATERLADAMQHLPELAERLDAGSAGDLFAGSADPSGSRWRVVFDFEEEDAAIERELALAAAPLADYVSPMELCGITVADDPGFLRALVAARNLPEFVKRDLPPLYGEKVPLPEGASFLRDGEDEVAPELLTTTRDLATFLRGYGELSLEQLRLIVDQAQTMLEQHYVHLPLKRAMYAVDPIQRLRLLAQRLEELDEGQGPPELEVHREIARIFYSLRDLHTGYRLPRPFRGKIAWLPFLIEEFFRGERRAYLVSKVVPGAGPESLEPGVEVTHFCGVPIERAIARHADEGPGGNPAARHQRGLDSLTIRPLSHGLPPDEEWVTLRYLDRDGRPQEYRQRWLLFEPGRAGELDPSKLRAEARGLGIDEHADEVQQAKKALYVGPLLATETEAARRGDRAPIEVSEGLATRFPTVVRARKEETAHGTFGYLRLFSFNVPDAGELVQELARLLEALPPDGLILDIRGNPGGLIHAAERALQLFTPRRVQPERAQFACTPGNLKLCRQNAPSDRFPGLDLGPWIPSLERSTRTGATYSLGHPITDPDLCNDLGQRYYGPVVLVIDGMTYSAADLFAAGFEDHEIGPILGISRTTGAGGANVWSHRLLSELAGAEYQPLPGGADLKVAARRTVRVGERAGAIVEDLGVSAEEIHRMTRADLLERNRDLIEAAARLLASRTARHLEISVAGSGGAPTVTVRASHVSRLDVLVNGRPRGSFDVDGAPLTLRLADLVPAPLPEPLDLELLGYDQQQLVLRHRRRLPGAPPG